MDKISVVVTTCGREDLLEKTIKSFNNANSHPIDEFIFINDGGENISHLVSTFNIKNFIVASNSEKRGQLHSIDLGYSIAKNNFIFHLEDDWMFDVEGNFLKDSVDILKNRQDIHQIWIRHDQDNPHKTEHELQDLNGVLGYYVIDGFQNVWNGFSFNPGLRRKDDYLKMFPDGYKAFKDEKECAIHLKKFNYKAFRLQETCCYHIGYGRSNY